ncbi:hypothetical protein TWF718_004581 [Orbilia javanica]|uniref:Uncharacterized protein n=1 Tax=Orbilia javanica TaxID=47235 RepID=A0AAN8N6G0_9PEZI
MVVLTTYITPLLILAIQTTHSIPVPPNDGPRTFVGRPGTRIQSTSQPPVNSPPEGSPPDQDITAVDANGTAETISIPSVNEEVTGRGGWMNNIAGPPLDTFASLRQQMVEHVSTPLPLYKQPFKGLKLQQESNLARLKTAHEEDIEESDPDELAYIPGGGGQIIDYNLSDGDELTARFKLGPEDRLLALDFSDAEDPGIDIDLDTESYEEEEKEPEYDPIRDPFYGDYPRRSPLRHKLRELLEEPLYKPLPSWKGKPEDQLIYVDDSSATARRKMRHNLQPILEGASILEMQSTLRGNNALPYLRKKHGAVNPKFLPQGSESLQLPSPGLNPSSRVGSIVNDYSNTNMNTEENRDPQVITLTLPEITNLFKPPKENVPKLRLNGNGQSPGL